MTLLSASVQLIHVFQNEYFSIFFDGNLEKWGQMVLLWILPYTAVECFISHKSIENIIDIEILCQ